MTNAEVIRAASDEGLTLWLLDGHELRAEIKAELDARQEIRQSGTSVLLRALCGTSERRVLILEVLAARNVAAAPVTDWAAVHAGVVEDYGLEA